MNKTHEKAEPTLEERLARVELLLLDVDGVLTEGKIRLDGAGNEIKAFDVTDGHGLKMLGRAGVSVGIITGRKSDVVRFRARELGIEEVHQRALSKLPVARDILKRLRLKPEQVCYVGDDIVDLPVMLQVGCAVTVPGAMDDVKERAHWITKRHGGAGAVREVCDAILKAKGVWEELTNKYFNPEPL